MVEAVGAEPVTSYDQKVTCCGGALAFSEPDKAQKQIRSIVESIALKRTKNVIAGNVEFKFLLIKRIYTLISF